MIPPARAEVMSADEIIDRIRSHRAQLDAFGVRSLGLFGSVARGEERAESDIDVLVAFDGPATFDQYIDLKLFLEDLLGRRVDLVTERGLRAAIRPAVERELRRVA
jgi:predicted nucleotidyltransferase